MGRCGRDAVELVELLVGEGSSGRAAGASAPVRKEDLLAHIEGCESCAAELASLRTAWTRLPGSEWSEAAPPALAREAVLARGRGAVGPHAATRAGTRADSPWSTIWASVRPLAAPALVGMAAPILIVALLEARGLVAVEGVWPTSLLSVVLGALLAGFAWIAGRTSVRVVRSVIAASAAAFAGYVVLTVALPIPETVEFCRVRVLAAPELSMGSLCLVYLGVSLLYGGIPTGLAAYRWSEEAWRPTTVLSQAALFVLLTLPLLGLHFGTAELILGLSVLAGLTAGAVFGGAAGRWMRHRRPSGAFA